MIFNVKCFCEFVKGFHSEIFAQVSINNVPGIYTVIPI